MSQAPVILPGSPLTGAAAAADINAAWAAMVSLFSGASAPTLGPGAASSLVTGQMWLDTSLSPAVWRVWDGTAWCPLAYIDSTNHLVAPALSWRNILGDNGGFEIWQRGAGSSASIAVGASSAIYVADRWYLSTGANQASTVSAVTGLTSQSNLAGKFQRNNGQTGTAGMGTGFPLDTDEVVRMRGQKVTLSAVVKAGANWSPTLGTLIMGFTIGTGAPSRTFTGPVTMISTSVNLSVGQQVTMVATSSAVVPANAAQAEVDFNWSPTGTAGADDSITIDDVQLEVGTMASPFERVPFEKALLGCKRHYAKTFAYGTAPAQNAGVVGALGAIVAINTSDVSWLWQFPVSMRITPVITLFNPSVANASARNVTAAADVAVTTDPNSTLSADRLFIVSSGTIASLGDKIYIHAAADGGIV